MRASAILAPLLLAGLLGAAPGNAQGSLAVDVARDAGLDVVHAGFRAGNGTNQGAFHEAMAGGACWGDYDRDGLLDVFLTDFLGPSGEGQARLYRNLGARGAEWRFEDVAAGQRVALRGVGEGCAWGDYDNDGWPDLYATFAVTPYAPQGNVLLRNLGQGRGFEDVSSRAGVGGASAGPGSEPCHPTVRFADGREVERCWSVGAAWLDHDQDGLLDLYVAQYSQFPFGTCTNEFPGDPRFCLGQPNRLYRNLGDGTFEEVAARAGVAANGLPTGGRSLGAIATDLDGDAWPDLYVANDKDGNALYLNQRNGTFRSAAADLGVDNLGPTNRGSVEHRAGMGLDAQDYDNDGAVDLVSTHLVGEPDGLFHWEGDRWRDLGQGSPLGAISTGPSRWGVGFEDLDLDGWKDLLVVAGGHGRMEPGGVHVFLQREGRFVQQGEPAWPFSKAERANHRAAAFADFDNDGDADVLVTALPTWLGAEARAKLLRFRAADEGGTWLRVGLEGTDGARDAIGAKVVVRSGDLAQWRWKASGGSYAGSNDPRLLFGLGGATRGTIEVVWPGGATQTQAFDLAGRPGLEVHLREPDARPPPAPRWAAEPVHLGKAGEAVLSWQPSFASDFAAYRVLQGRGAGFEAAGARVHEVADRAATSLVLDLAHGAHFRLLARDRGGHESEPAEEVSALGAPERPREDVAPAPGPGLALLLAAVAAAVLSRRRPRS